MKRLHFLLILLFLIFSSPIKAQESKSAQRLAKFLNQYPEADTNKDGKLSREELDAFRTKIKPSRSKGSRGPKSPMKRYSLDEMSAVYEAKEYKGMPYRLMKPIHFKNDANIKYPLILSLHGAGGKGNDNKKNLKVWNGVLAEKTLREKHPCFVIAPQSPVGWRKPGSVPELSKQERDQFPEAWKKVVSNGRAWLEDVPEGRLPIVFELLDTISKQYPIDLNRVYVLGHSMGGFGTFESIALQPGRFAAAIPSAGGMLPWHDISKMTNIPIWAFHGNQDTTVPIGLTQYVFEQMKKQNGNMKLTELGGVGHGSNGFAFIYTGDQMSKGFVTHSSSDKCDQTSDIWDWLFAQERNPPKQ